ncbi:hypothetical protein EV360DRAFT_84540 [Lentinula raphanica]|nr:hypothetical protein EV360DRAFT_84540 [Lentinula raphanica]
MPVTRLSRQDSVIEVQPSPNLRNSKNRTSKPPRPKPIVYQDVIEISDSEDGQAIAPSHLPLKRKHDLQLERDLKKLKQENDELKNKENKYKADIARSQDELTLLRSTYSNASSSKDHVAISQLDDSITCEVCAAKMWTPYMWVARSIKPLYMTPNLVSSLACGHTYCKSCLQDWFSTILQKHMAAHPQYRLNNQPPRTATRDPVAIYAEAMVRALYNNAGVPEPQYTCPTCREQVRSPPVEDFNLKKIVRAVASAQGEASPQKEVTRPSGRTSRAREKAPAGREDPWSGFFPKRT